MASVIGIAINEPRGDTGIESPMRLAIASSISYVVESCSLYCVLFYTNLYRYTSRIICGTCIFNWPLRKEYQPILFGRCVFISAERSTINFLRKSVRECLSYTTEIHTAVYPMKLGFQTEIDIFVKLSGYNYNLIDTSLSLCTTGERAFWSDVGTRYYK